MTRLFGGKLVSRRAMIACGRETGNVLNLPEEIRGVINKTSNSTNQSSRTAWDVLAERFSQAKRARKPKLTATMKRRALKRKKTDDKSLSRPAAGS
jgi:hypothetical protein